MMVRLVIWRFLECVLCLLLQLGLMAMAVIVTMVATRSLVLPPSALVVLLCAVVLMVIGIFSADWISRRFDAARKAFVGFGR